MNRKFIASLLVLSLLCIAPLSWGITTAEKLTEAYKQGLIDRNELVVYRFLSIFPNAVENVIPNQFVSKSDEKVQSGTGFISQLMNEWGNLTYSQKNLVMPYIYGLTASDRDEYGAMGYYPNLFGTDDILRYPENDADAEHFIVWWANGDAYFDYNDAVDMYNYYEVSYDVTVNENYWWGGPNDIWNDPDYPEDNILDAPQGWMPLLDYYGDISHPLYGDFGDFGDEYGIEIYLDTLYPSHHWDVHVFNIEALGYTQPYNPFYPGLYVDINEDTDVFLPDSFPDDYWTDRVESCVFWAMDNTETTGWDRDETAAHEFHHGVQSGYDTVVEFQSWQEHLSMWNQSEVYPDTHSMITNRANNYLHAPQSYLWKFNGQVEYNHCLWALFIESFFANEFITPPVAPEKGPMWVLQAEELGDEWFKGNTFPGGTDLVDRDIEAAHGWLYARDLGVTGISDEEDYDLDYEYFQELFVHFPRYMWFTNLRDDGTWWEDNRYADLDTVYATRGYDSAAPVPDGGEIDQYIIQSDRPDILGSNFIRIEEIPSSLPGGWGNTITFKFLADRLNPERSRQWDGWVITHENGEASDAGWTWNRINCPWDNGIAQVDVTNVDELVFIVLNKSMSHLQDDFDELLYYLYSIIETTETVAPVVSCAPVVMDGIPEHITFNIGANEQCHGVPYVKVDFTMTGETTPETTYIYSDWFDDTNPVYTAKFNLDLGESGDGSVDVAIYDVYGNEGTYNTGFSAANVPEGGLATIGDENYKLYLAPGVLTKSGIVALFEEKLNLKEDSLSESESNDLFSSSGTSAPSLFTGDDSDPVIYDKGVRVISAGEFNGYARLTISYADLNVADEEKVSVYKANGKGGWYEIGGVIDVKYDKITADISETGVYTLGLGSGSTLGGGELTPTSFSLSQNYPNPVSDSTSIKYSVSSASEVTIDIYNIAGQLVKRLDSGVKEPGEYTLLWDATDSNGSDVPSGVYIYHMSAPGQFSDSRKMVVVK